MEKLLKRAKFNILLEKISTLDQKKTQQYLLVGLIVFLWVFSGLVFILGAEVERIADTPPKTYQLSKMEVRIKKMVAGYPIEKMSKYIAMQDEKTAAFMIAIAKKESNWGERVPVLNGEDCFNYWGYRQKRERMGSEGHTCFDNSRDAVNTVSHRINELVVEYNLDTPSKMVVWKCGYGCKNSDKQSVKKWISDVDIYYQELIN